MPILNYRHQESPPCTCCGEATRSTTGTVDLGWDPAPVYIARWNPRVPEHGIALLIGLGDPRGFVAAKYALESDAITVIGPEDYDWQSSSIQILDRNDVIDTTLATMALRVIDEIWMHDPEIQSFTGKDSNASPKPNKASHHKPLPAPSSISLGSYNPQPVSKPRSR